MNQKRLEDFSVCFVYFSFINESHEWNMNMNSKTRICCIWTKEFLRSSIYAEDFFGSFFFIFSYFSIIIFSACHCLLTPWFCSSFIRFAPCESCLTPSRRSTRAVEQSFRRLNMTHCAVHNMIESCNYMSKKKSRVEGAKDSATHREPKNSK